MQRPQHGGDRLWAAQVAGCQPEAVLDFSANLNPLGPPAWVRDFIQSHHHLLIEYPDPQYRELRRHLAAFHHLEPAWIWPGNGAAHLLTWVGRELAALGTVTLVTPAFGDHWRALQAFGAQVQPWHLPWEQKQVAFPADKHGLLLSNPHNPTGYLFTRDQLLDALENRPLVVVDESFMDFVPPAQDQSLIPVLERFPHLVILRSLTKFYALAGLRLGYVLAHPDRIARYREWDAPWSVNGLAAALGGLLIQEQDFAQRTWDWLAQERPRLQEGLATIPGLHPYPSAANFLLVKSAQPVPDLQQRLLVKHHILIRDTLSYPELGPNYFRVAVRLAQDNQRLLQALGCEGVTS
ncbi:MAG: threonine-phosphate decarboxylase CobD [Gloeomargarita sp. SKYG116]|nr:threonine-phosphate decarboxylase CobD [Gloeomargarita sp. SKYG116]MDW8401796.1 threonine-phosphate decarboxylase CobD [Gloeomargarita sp. SKYGB_i_bin116]